MFEMIEKINSQGNKKDIYASGQSEQVLPNVQRRSIADDVRVYSRPAVLIQRQKSDSQAVIQCELYEDYHKWLREIAGRGMDGRILELIGRIEEYLNRKGEVSEGRDRNEGLAELLSKALEISKAANKISQELENNDENVKLKEKLRALGKFVHVELSQDETMSLDDLSDILHRVREMQKDTDGQKIRELGLLSITDRKQQEEQKKLVLMINGGGSLEGTGGSVAAPGESTPVFSENWKDVEFIAHTHPNEFGLQTNEEFKMDVAVAKPDRAEMVRRDDIDGKGGVGGTIFYMAHRVMNGKSNERYVGRFAVREDNLTSILDENRERFVNRLAEEQKEQYEEFIRTFTGTIIQKIQDRDRIANKLIREKLSASEFLHLEQQLAQLGVDSPEVFDASRLKEKFADDYWKIFPKSPVQEEDLCKLFSMLADSVNFSTEEEK
ncbi:MAG: hypothetical protein K2K56_14035 [Lachnospiraceae bacterium]|nr:hypothetical protein [Lachnospiraceae bacterium]